jgi:hypothetical protein
MSARDELTAALSAAEQALASTREGRDDLVKLQSGGLAKDIGTAALTKMTNLLETIRDRLVVLEASERAHPQHWSTQ